MASTSIVSDSRLQEAFSLALEQRSPGYADLVSNSNAILAMMKKRGGWKSFSGPTIRERLLYNESGTYVRYSGADFLNPAPAELFNDAEYTPKLAAVSVMLTYEDILKNSGSSQLRNIVTDHIAAAETELQDRFVEDLHSAGTETNQIGGLQAAVPTTVTNTYGGIDRNTVTLWKTGSYNGNSDFSAATVEANIHDQYTRVLIAHTRGRQGPNLIAADSTHYRYFQQALVAHQRVMKDGEMNKLGFPSLAFSGAGYNLDVVLEGGIGSAMPSDTSYFLKVGADGICFRYHPQRNFTAFGGRQRPINQDAMVQHVGFFGNVTIANPLFQAKLISS